MRQFLIAGLLASCAAWLHGATLERLSFTDMVAKSTAVVRGKVLSSQAAFTGGLIYTHYRVQVTESLKGAQSGTVDLAVPGGVAKGVRQAVSGAPEFQPGDDCVFFLWTSRAGITQVIGLTQGIFRIAGSGSDPAVMRAASDELMLDRATHQPVKDAPLHMKLSELRSAVAQSRGGAK